MKQQILNLKKKLLLIEIGGELSKKFLDIMNEHGMAEIIGKLTDITEEQLAAFISSKWMLTTNSDNVLRYKDYMAIFDPYNKSTAKESFFSYLEKEGVYFENPLDWEKKAYLFKGSENSWGHDDLKRWQEAEEKVWNKNNCYVFEII